MSSKHGPFARSVSIVGVGCTPIGNVAVHPEIKDMTERELFSWACQEALDDAGITAHEIDCLYVGEVYSETCASQTSTSGIMSCWTGMEDKPAFRHETACCTALSGLHHACLAVASGMYDFAMSGGVDVMSVIAQTGKPPFMRVPLKLEDALFVANGFGCDQAYWYPGGDLTAFLEANYIHYGSKYGFTLEQLKEAMNRITIMSRHNAVNNPLALYSTKTYEEEAKEFGFDSAVDYLNSPYNPKVGALLTLKNGSFAADGASALIVCPTEIAKKLKPDVPVAEVTGLGMAATMGYRKATIPIDINAASFKQSLDMAGITDPYNEIDYLAIHDCSAQNYIQVSEDAGYIKPGEGVEAALTGRFAPDGDKPVNTSGGRLNLGHPLAGAAGYEIAEAVWQMQGKCGKRQMKNPPETVLVQGYGAGMHVASAVLRAV